MKDRVTVVANRDPPPALLDVAGLRHDAGGRRLRLLPARPSPSSEPASAAGNVLTHIGADALELGNGDELHARVRHRILGRLGRDRPIMIAFSTMAAKGAAF